jgi:aminoglycoside phosphotransferase (APT) family kinase protein
VPYDEFDRLDVPKRLMQLKGNMEKVAELGLWTEWSEIHVIIELLQNQVSEEYTKKMVHGDLHIRNVLVNQARELSAVIDWGDAHIGHPALDISMIYSCFSTEGRKLFYSIYGEVTDITKRLARFSSINTNLYLLLYGYDLKDELLVATAQASLRLVLQNE